MRNQTEALQAELGRRMTIDEAVQYFRRNARFSQTVRDAYLGRDVRESADRFIRSAEFLGVRELLGDALPGAVIVDLGAGTGIASYAFLKSGASKVFAVEPDPSHEVGQGAIRRLAAGDQLDIVSAFGEAIPLAAGTADIVYARQVLHHTRDLCAVLRECARLLRPGGLFLATREHVINDERQLQKFLRKHPMHQLAGGENAYRLTEYLTAIRESGLELLQTLGPWDTVINAFPHARSVVELAELPAVLMRRRFGSLGARVGAIPLLQRALWALIRRERPGRMYSFIARKR